MPKEQEYYRVHPEVLKAFEEWQAERSSDRLTSKDMPSIMAGILTNILSFIIFVCGVWKIIDILVWIVEKIF